MADKKPNAAPEGFEEAPIPEGFEAASAPEGFEEAPVPSGFEEAPTGDNLQFDVRTEKEAPKVATSSDYPLQPGIAQEASIADMITAGGGGLGQGAALGMRAPLDYATAGLEHVAEKIAPIEGSDAIPRGTQSDFDQSLEATRAVRKESEEKAKGLHAAGEFAGTVGSSFVPLMPASVAGHAAEWAGTQVGGRLAGGIAKGAAKLKGLGEVAPIQQGLFTRAVGESAKLATEAAVASAPFGAARELDKAYETKDWDNITEKMAGGARDEMITGVKYGAPLMGAIGLARKGFPQASQVEDFANGRAFKGLGGKKGDIALAEMRIEGGGNAVGRAMLDEGVITNSDLSLEGTALRANVMRTLLGQELGRARARIGGMGAAPSASGLMDKIERNVLAEARSNSVLDKEYRSFAKENKALFEELNANRPAPPTYDTLGMLQTPKGATHEPATYRPATPEDLELQRRMQAAQGTGDVNPESLGLRVPKQEYDTLGMPVSPRLAPESYTQGTRAPTPDELAMREAMRQAPRGGTATPESLAAVGNSLEGVPLDPLGQPIGRGDVPPSPWRITGSKATPTEQVATSFGPGEQMSTPGYITGPAPGGAPPMVAVPGEMRLNPDEIQFDRLNKLRIAIDQKRAHYGKIGQANDTKAELYRKMRTEMDRHWMDAAEEAAQKSGNPQAIEEIKVLKDRYAKMATASDLLNETVARKDANRTFSMSDTQIGQVGALAAAVAQGTPLTSIATGLGSAGLNKTMRERGNFLMSTVLSRNAKRAIRVQEAIKKSAKLTGVTSPKAIPAITVGRELKQEVDPEKAVDHAEKLQDPKSDEYQKKTSFLQEMEVEGGPQLVQALDKKITAHNEFILEKAGPAPAPSPFGGPPPKRDFDPETKEQLSRYIQPLRNPEDALARVGDGVATPEDYEVLEQQYPKMWQEFQQTAVHGLADKNLDHDQQLAVADALKLPLLPQMTGEYMAFWQNVAAQGSAIDQMKADEKAANENKANLSGGQNVASKADRTATA